MNDKSNGAAPQINPGEISNWPMLKLMYKTKPENIARLLPPGIEAGAEANVNLTIYNFPVPSEPEYGVVTSVDANYRGIAGEYTLGYGIDQESAIFISQELNGQPKYPCDIRYYRFGDQVYARCIHQGYTFLEFRGKSLGAAPIPEPHEQHEFWIKVSRATGVAYDPAAGYDFPPHVVHVHSSYGTAHLEKVEGDLQLFPSPWDPLAQKLPMLPGTLVAQLWTPTFLGREVTLAGKLDEQAFQPFADVISGSRWPGQNGGPRIA